MSNGAEPREKRQWWVVDDGNVKRAVGLSCESVSRYWWFSSMGFSACEGFHVFDLEADARRAAIEELTKQRQVIDRKLQDLLK